MTIQKVVQGEPGYGLQNLPEHREHVFLWIDAIKYPVCLEMENEEWCWAGCGTPSFGCSNVEAGDEWSYE